MFVIQCWVSVFWLVYVLCTNYLYLYFVTAPNSWLETLSFSSTCLYSLQTKVSCFWKIWQNWHWFCFKETVTSSPIKHSEFCFSHGFFLFHLRNQLCRNTHAHTPAHNMFFSQSKLGRLTNLDRLNSTPREFHLVRFFF